MHSVIILSSRGQQATVPDSGNMCGGDAVCVSVYTLSDGDC